MLHKVLYNPDIIYKIFQVCIVLKYALFDIGLQFI